MAKGTERVDLLADVERLVLFLRLHGWVITWAQTLKRVEENRSGREMDAVGDCRLWLFRCSSAQSKQNSLSAAILTT